MRKARFVGPSIEWSMKKIVEKKSPVRVNPATEKSLAKVAVIGFEVGDSWAAEDLSMECHMENAIYWLLDKTKKDPAEIDPRTISVLVEAAWKGFYEGGHF